MTGVLCKSFIFPVTGPLTAVLVFFLLTVPTLPRVQYWPKQGEVNLWWQRRCLFLLLQVWDLYEFRSVYKTVNNNNNKKILTMIHVSSFFHVFVSNYLFFDNPTAEIYPHNFWQIGATPASSTHREYETLKCVHGCVYITLCSRSITFE